MNTLSRRKIRRVRNLMILTGIILVAAIISLFMGIPWPLGIAGAAALIAGAQTHKAYRCPHCNKGLPYISPKGDDAGDCPYCGQRIQFDD